MSSGFIYLLGNRAMPCFYKIGCTERSPHARARELSNASGVPDSFDVLLYIEVEDFQRVERHFHQALVDFRPNHAREFFCFGPAHMTWLWWVFKTWDYLSFASPRWHRYAPVPTFPDEYKEAWIDDGELLMPCAPPIDGPAIKVTVD